MKTCGGCGAALAPQQKRPNCYDCDSRCGCGAIKDYRAVACAKCAAKKRAPVQIAAMCRARWDGIQGQPERRCKRCGRPFRGWDKGPGQPRLYCTRECFHADQRGKRRRRVRASAETPSPLPFLGNRGSSGG